MSDIATTLPTQRTVDDYKSDEKPTWCPGCGDFGVLNAVYNALKSKGYAPAEVVTVSGIGCSSRLPYFMSTYGFHSLHGRSMPIATGVKVANPDLKVLAVGGDGDAFAIGAGHTVHAIRRNIDICYVDHGQLDLRPDQGPDVADERDRLHDEDDAAGQRRSSRSTRCCWRSPPARPSSPAASRASRRSSPS